MYLFFSQIIKLAYEKKSPKKKQQHQSPKNKLLLKYVAFCKEQCLISLSYRTDRKHDPRMSECMAFPSRGR